MTDLPEIVAAHLKGVNSFDVDAALAPFADDAFVNDARREIRGKAAIRRWIERELVGDSVTVEVTDVVAHHGGAIVRGRYEGTFDRTNLPEEVVLSNYFGIDDGQIVSLIVILNHPSEY